MVIEYGGFQINKSIFANVFVFYTFGLSLHPDFDTHIFGHCIIVHNFFSHYPRSPPSKCEGAHTPNAHRSSCYHM